MSLIKKRLGKINDSWSIPSTSLLATFIFSVPTTVLSINPYYRLDNVKYFDSPDEFSDQPITFNQSRRLNNVWA